MGPFSNMQTKCRVPRREMLAYANGRVVEQPQQIKQPTRTNFSGDPRRGCGGKGLRWKSG